MPRGVKKENLPSKICVTCNRTFTWRKKWEKVWDEVTTCSKSCNRKRREARQQQSMLAASATSEEISGEEDEVMPVTNELREVNIAAKKEPDNLGSQNPLSSFLVGSESGPTANVTGDEGIATWSADGGSDEEADSIASGADKDDILDDPVAQRKAARKAAKKANKAARRAQRQGLDTTGGQKPCDVCKKSVDLLIRCQIDESLQWKMVCGKCWNVVSGGVVDGDAAHPHYRYGGLWKNRRRK